MKGRKGASSVGSVIEKKKKKTKLAPLTPSALGGIGKFSLNWIKKKSQSDAVGRAERGLIFPPKRTRASDTTALKDLAGNTTH